MKYKNLVSIALFASTVGCLSARLPPVYNLQFSPAKVSKCPTANLQIPEQNLQTIVAEFEVSKSIDIPDGTVRVTMDYLICAYDSKSETRKLNDDGNILKVYAINDLKSGNIHPSIIIRREEVDDKSGAYFTIEGEGNPIDEGKPTLTFYRTLSNPESFSRLIQDFLGIITEKRAKKENLLPSSENVSGRNNGIEI